MYFTILASLFKYKGESERAAIKWCQKYVDKFYHDEMVEAVLNVYRRIKHIGLAIKRLPVFYAFPLKIFLKAIVISVRKEELQQRK